MTGESEMRAISQPAQNVTGRVLVADAPERGTTPCLAMRGTASSVGAPVAPSVAMRRMWSGGGAFEGFSSREKTA